MYNFDDHNWGFQFRVPKFQGFDSLYLSCEAYVCDTQFDEKPYCDRSCPSDSDAKVKASGGDSTLRHSGEVPPGLTSIRPTAAGPRERRRRAAEVDEGRREEDHEDAVRRLDARTGSGRSAVGGHVASGQFVVEDDGIGPLILPNGDVIVDDESSG